MEYSEFEPDGHTRVTADKITAMMAESLFWDNATTEQYQRLQLTQLLNHARTTVPFYKTRLDCMFRHDGSIDWSRWHEIPIVTKADLRDKRDEMLSSKPLANHGRIYTNYSSGSTGVPVAISFPILSYNVAGIAWKRFLSLHRVDIMKGYSNSKMALPPPAGPDDDYILTDNPINRAPEFLILAKVKPERQIQALAKSPFSIFFDLPNSLEILARENLRQGRPVKLDKIIGIGMGFTEEQKELMKESFGATTLSPYSSKEGTLMAFQCPHGNDHFHCCNELAMIEILNDEGKEVDVGETGRNIITPLFNSAQPLIRYQIGDLVMRGNVCSGGITLPVIKEISGRMDMVFKLPGGDVTPRAIDAKLLREELHADAVQIAQTGANHLEVRYLSKVSASENEAQTISDHIKTVLGINSSISFLRVDDIPRNSGGKQQRYVREYEAPQKKTA